MSNKDLVDMNGVKLKEKEVEPEDIRVEVHPNYLFAIPIKKEKTKGGVYLPDNVNKKEGTPICKILKLGSSVAEQYDGWLKEGDYVYVNVRYAEAAMLDDITGVILMADGIFGKIPQEEGNNE